MLGKGGIDIAEYLCVHYIGRGNERRLAIDGRVSDHNGDVVGVPNPGESDVELAVGEGRRGQVEGNLLEGLALGLVDGHGEGGADGELSATDLYGYALSMGGFIIRLVNVVCVVVAPRLGFEHRSRRTPLPIHTSERHDS